MTCPGWRANTSRATDVTRTTAYHDHVILRRVAPLATGAALAGAAVLVAANDPLAAGSHFPSCIFRSTTGLWCPGCGLTRGMHQLFTGHPLAALGENLFVPALVVAVSWAWWSWVRTSFDRRAVRVPSWAPQLSAVVLPTVLVLYGVLRNIPHAPFTALAP